MTSYTSSFGFGRAAALCLLPCMSVYAARILLEPLFNSDDGKSISKVCQQGSTLLGPAALRYTGVNALDEDMCILVTFMQKALDSHKAPFAAEFFASLGPAVILPAIEMRRAGYKASTVLSSMLVLGLIYQHLGAGVVLPLWWALHLLLSGLRNTTIPSHYAESAFAGYLLGYVALSIAMVTYQTVAITALWQTFPVCVVLVQMLYLGFHRSVSEVAPDSPYEVLQLIHVTSFCWSAVTHASTLFQALTSPAPLDALKYAFHPTYSPAFLGPVTALAQEFLKWDAIFIVGSTLFAGLWLLRGVRPKLLATAWFLVGSLCFGTGAGLAGVWMWREKVLEEDRRALVGQQKRD
ncbi:hypothetical protein BDV93DRAFT_526001 [Ceratobasidium sp. AG-I]|nr:hypothetical protein BDV93DRAFT_526001 [Ceratobasidium sp. AG-I]